MINTLVLNVIFIQQVHSACSVVVDKKRIALNRNLHRCLSRELYHENYIQTKKVSRSKRLNHFLLFFYFA